MSLKYLQVSLDGDDCVFFLSTKPLPNIATSLNPLAIISGVILNHRTSQVNCLYANLGLLCWTVSNFYL